MHDPLHLPSMVAVSRIFLDDVVHANEDKTFSPNEEKKRKMEV